MDSVKQNNFAILMAGGVGSRFWPVSTVSRPKQFRDLLGSGESLLQTTFRRLERIVPRENIYILTNQMYSELVLEQLPEVQQEQVLGEPVMRNTAPPVLFAASLIHRKNPNATMIMAPSDHWIQDEEAFARDIRLAVNQVKENRSIITLGIKPSFPNTGYGYIEYNLEDSSRIKRVYKFTEKPDFQLAKEFLERGNFLWNSGIFIWNVSYILESFRKNLPEMYQLLAADADLLTGGHFEQQYTKAENISIDYGILEKERENLFVIPASFDWNDLGTWGSLYQECPKDAQQNVVLKAQVHAERSSGNIISTADDKIVVIENMQDYIVVDEEKILLIVPKDKEQSIKEIRHSVLKKFGQDLG